MRRVRRRWIAAAATAGLLSLPSVSKAAVSPFEVGAAQTDITPPALATAAGQALDAAEFTPVCGATESQIATLWPGKRLFAFEDPYIDVFGAGQYVPGDPFCDADHAGRYEAPYIAGGSGSNHWPLTSGDGSSAFNTPATTPTESNFKADPIGAQAVVFNKGGQKAAMVTVDSIGLFDTTMDQIRAAVDAVDPSLAADHIFISSTHDESAPDPIGLWGPDLSNEPSPVNQLNGQLPAGVTSGVDDYYMSYLVQRVASAIVAADRSSRPATLRAVTARLPANAQSCWSSYPFIDTQLMPVLQAVDRSGHVVFTLVNVGTHDETLAFSGNPAYTSMLSGDWTGRLSAWLEAAYPGSVGMEMAGLVGSVETPALYPAGTQVLNVPGAHHGVPGNPVDGCSSVYPQPAAAPYTDALAFVDAFGHAVADTAIQALSGSGVASVDPRSIRAQAQPVCVQLENNFFVAAFALRLFPDRPAYADPACTVGLTLSGQLSVSRPSNLAAIHPAAPAFLRSEVGVLTLGQVQIAYSPGEVFPVTEVGGPFDPAQMPFPTNCYLPVVNNYNCGTPLPMTADISADMTAPFRFLAGLGEDMIGYLFPPSNFVGSQGEVLETPWSLYEETSGGSDRFGYGHSDDSESVGPNVGLAVTDALTGLLAQDGHGTPVVPGMFVDASGRLCDSPFATTGPSWVAGCGAFAGAVGVKVITGGQIRIIRIGQGIGWATYLGTLDSGTAGTDYAYSTATRGVIIDGRPLLIDAVGGSRQLG